MELFTLDCESTGLSFSKHEPIEISIKRFSTGAQKTWWLKPINLDTIESDALRVNGHKLEDITWQTKFGKEKYIEASKVLVDIENWLSEDFLAAEDRIACGHNISGFDKMMLMSLWEKCNSIETFPFNKKYVIDTFLIEFMMDFCKGEFTNAYSLFALCKKYGIKNEAAHTAASDAVSTEAIFKKQLEKFKKLTG
jgi:DNA polymerase III epsilon subunit-like protein